MKLTAFLILAFSMILIDPELRIYLVVPVVFMFALLCMEKPRAGLAIIALSIGTPVYIRVLGRDATTLTTLLIFVLFFVSVWKGMRIEAKLLLPAGTIILVYAIGASNLIHQPDLLLQALRFVAALTSGFMLLLSCQWLLQERSDQVIISRLLLLMVALQSLIAFIQIKAPGLTPLFAPFSARGQTVAATLEDGFLRAKGTMGGWELLAEWIAGVFPLGMFFLLRNKRINLPYVPLLLLLAIGLISTVTRGSVLALIASMILFMTGLVFLGKIGCVNLYIISMLALVSSLALFVVFRDGITNLLLRFQLAGASAVNSRSGFESLAVLLNRQIWFRLASGATTNYVLGNGYLPFQQNSWNIHSLFFTIWYQTGIIGSISWAMILLIVAGKYLRRFNEPNNGSDPVLLLAYTAGLIAMLLSEIKVEFLRLETTMQFFLLFVGLGIAVSSAGFVAMPEQGCASRAPMVVATDPG